MQINLVHSLQNSEYIRSILKLKKMQWHFFKYVQLSLNYLGEKQHRFCESNITLGEKEYHF